MYDTRESFVSLENYFCKVYEMHYSFFAATVGAFGLGTVLGIILIMHYVLIITVL